jgi:hypothetical protein
VSGAVAAPVLTATSILPDRRRHRTTYRPGRLPITATISAPEPP